MRSSVLCLLVVFGAAVFVPAANADIPPPVPPAKKLPLKIEVDENAKESKLLLPQIGIFTPRGPVPRGPKGELPVERDAIGQAAPSNLQLVMAGIALTLGLSFGGLWLARKRESGRGLVLLVIVAVGGLLAAGGMLWANQAAPPLVRKAAPPQENLAVILDSNVEFQVIQVGTGDTIRLILTKADFAKLSQKTKPAEGH
jgi:hypothetical protein